MSVSNSPAILRRRQRGVSIVEALVAFVILSVGLLGIAGLYLESVRSNRTALTRTAAVQLANDLADRIRANRSAEGAYALQPLGTVPTGPSTTTACVTSSCTPAVLASYDLKTWYDHVLLVIPKDPDGTTPPRVGVAYTNGTNVSTPDRYVITIAWMEPGDTSLLSTSVEVMQLGDQ